MSEGPLWIDEAAVAELISLRDAIDVLAESYRLQARGEARNMTRAHVREGESILHAVGGTIAGLGVAGTKTWTYTPAGASPLIVLFDLRTGATMAVIEAFALGQMRTAATSGLGTSVLALHDAHTLALLGTGKQAFAQAEAVTTVRDIMQIRVFGREPTRRAELATRLRVHLEVDVVEHASAAEAIDGADIVTAITRAAEPFVTGAMLRPGMHVNAVGAIVPTRRELDETAVGRCDVVVADSPDQARADSGELRAAAEQGLLAWEDVRGLESFVEAQAALVREPREVTLFKALGIGLSDVALGAEVLRRARLMRAGCHRA
jgi:alanine dehydrogenase